MKRRPGAGAHNPNPQRQQQIAVSLGKPSLRLRMESYYTLIQPDIIANQMEWREKFDQIYEKFGGSHEGERRLASKLAKKYGTGVRLLLAKSVLERKQPTTVSPQKASTVDNLAVHGETWYDLRPGEVDSGDVDFLSDCFDPISALRRPQSEVVNMNPWISECPVFESVAKFSTHLPASDPLRRVPSRELHGKKRSSQEQPTNVSCKKTKSSSPFVSIAQNYEIGPLSVLFKLQNQRVRVLVRYVNAIRGTLTGTLVAFDKHMNMILRDCEEIYSPRPSGGNRNDQIESNIDNELNRRRNALQECIGDHSNVSGTSKTDWSIRQRTMKQIMIRGDNVVLVYKAAVECSTWPKTLKSPAKSLYFQHVTAVPDEERVGSPGSLVYGFQRKQKRDS